MGLTLKRRIIGLALVAALLPILVTFFLLSRQSETLCGRVIDEMNAISRAESDQVTKLVYDMCDIANRRLEIRLRDHLTGAQSLLDHRGRVTMGSTRVPWKARNQSTGETITVSMPVMHLGGEPLKVTSDFDVEVPVVDMVKKLTRDHCTIFQRMNAQGDMLRVATTLPAEDKRRAVGTFIPRRQPDGSETPIVATVLRGETYVGHLQMFGGWYVGAYCPMRDSEGHGDVIGALFVGVNLTEASHELREAIMRITVGKTGYVYVLGTKGDRRGRYIISKGGRTDGLDIWNSQDDEGRFFIQSIIKKALETPPGALARERYPWKNPEDPAPRMKSAVFTYAPVWDWVIATSLYEDDYLTLLAEVRATVRGVLATGTAGGSLVMLVVLAMAIWLGGEIARPITQIAGVAKVVAEGNLAGAGERIDQIRQSLAGSAQLTLDRAGTSGATDETGQLLDAVHTMTGNLTALVGQVQRSSVQLVSTATEISATSREQENTVTDFGTSTTQIAAAVREISATSQELARTMQNVQTAVSETAALADAGRAGLSQMESSMGQLADATASISGRLAVINDKAGNINNVMTTILKVADQTNLLSLNAAIEAEKAGEYGLGFSVVAREIRRLADQTAVASQEIEQTVKEMQSSVTAGVMEMDKFTSEVAQSVRSANAISAQMGGIIHQVKELMPRFEAVADGMRAQSAGAQQINEAMVQLSEGARRTSDSLQYFNQATDQLKEAARGLQKEAARFRV
ncbi:MAG: methyl-accepting chemotaxis protein [Candidatus Riflebacteria bacterium]|nr:methyl-accepting chemotaxis protein [Candidatus Riflebacteria bacterium]